MRSYVFSLIIFFTGHALAQSGCTDPLAMNYNSSALINDGSCSYAPVSMAIHENSVLPTAIPESSGLIFLNGVVWTHNDSGHTPQIFKLDTATAGILQTVSIANYPNIDWEDIAADSSYIYIGDFGNNDGNRTDLKILRINRDSIPATGAATVNAAAINFSYSDQTVFTANSSTNFDCESLISFGNALYIFSKNRGDAQTRVYKLSKTPGTYTISPYTNYNVNGEITGADYNSQTHEVVLIGYLSTKKNSFLWFLNDFTGDLFFSGNKRRIEIGNSQAKWQTEGVAYFGPSSLFISNENSDYPGALYEAYKPFATLLEIKQNKLNDEDIKIYPNPIADRITIESATTINNLQLISGDGRIVYQQNPGQKKVTILLTDLILSESVLLLKVNSGNGNFTKKLVLNKN